MNKIKQSESTGLTIRNTILIIFAEQVFNSAELVWVYYEYSHTLFAEGIQQVFVTVRKRLLYIFEWIWMDKKSYVPYQACYTSV